MSCSEVWSTTIDGAVVSNVLAYDASARCSSLAHSAQHQPVIVELKTRAVVSNSHAWIHPEPGEPSWDEKSTKLFLDAISCDIDHAWALWHHFSGGRSQHSYSSLRCAHGSWTVGAADPALRGLWKQYRRALAFAQHAW